jgi:hypothetical protein
MAQRITVSDRRKKQVRRKANRGARQEARPEARALQRDRKQARAEFRRSVRSTEGAADYLQGTLKKAMKGVKKSGLKGRSQAMLTRELAGQMSDAAKMVPFERAAARTEMREQVGDINRSLTSVRTAQQATARENFRSMIDQIKSNKATRVEERLANRESRAKESKTKRTAQRSADIAARALLRETVEAARPAQGVAGGVAYNVGRGGGSSPESREGYDAAQKNLEGLKAIKRGEGWALDKWAVELVKNSEGVNLPQARQAILRIVKQSRR